MQRAAAWARCSGSLHSIIDGALSNYAIFSDPLFHSATRSFFEFGSPSLIRARDIKIISWKWNGAYRDSRQRFFLVSQAGGLLSDGPESHECWLDMFPFVQRDGNAYNLDLSGAMSIELSNANELFWAGGNSHFGHWFGDVLHRFIWHQNFHRDSFEILSNYLTEFQSHVLQGLFTRLPNVTLLPESEAQLTVYHVPRLAVLACVPISMRWCLIRRQIRKVFNNSQKHNYKPIYLYRGYQGGVRRVANEEELVNHLISQDLAIVLDPSQLSFRELGNLLIDQKFFIIPSGSANTNFFIFGDDNSLMLYLVPRGFQRNSATFKYGAYEYIRPFESHTEYFHSNLAQSGIGGHDANFIVDIESLTERINNLTFREP